ncbi:MAG: ABC transporter substrate-binding protein [Janthinobacterium lividum]
MFCRISASALSAAGTLAVAGLALAACGSDSLAGSPDTSAGSSSTSSAPTPAAPATDASLRAMLPQSVQDTGILRVGTDASYAPNEFLDGDTIKGMEVDLLNAVAVKLGVQVNYTDANFDSLIPGVNGNSYDVALSSFSITKDRLAQVNMVQYYNAGTQWVTKKGNPDGIDPDFDDCGKTVAVQSNTTQSDDDLPPRSKTCTDAGKPAVNVLAFDVQRDATAAVVQGRAVAMLADSPISAYAVKQTGDQLQLTGDIYNAAPYGMVVAKDQTSEAEAISKALALIAADGSYKAALDNWGGAAGAVTVFPVNPTVS